MNQLKAALQWLYTHPQVVIIILFFLGSILARIAKEYRTLRKKREQSAALERAELERLRTGQRVEAPLPAELPQATRPTADTIAEARKRKLEEMRQNRQRAGRPQMRPTASVRMPTARSTNQPNRPATPPTLTSTIRLPGGIVLEVPIAGPEPQPQPRTRRERRPQPDSEERKSTQTQAVAPPATSAYDIHPKVKAGLRPGGARPVTLLGSMDRDAMRRALVLREVLGPPKSMEPLS